MKMIKYIRCFFSSTITKREIPLGSHASIHKLGAAYITLPCFPPRFASQLKFIFLALLFYSSDRCAHGNWSVFRSLIDELNFLSREGICTVTPDGFDGVVKFELGAILGENLGLHSILGFVESFRANYACKICRSPKELLSKQTVEDDMLLRDIDNNESDLVINDHSRTGVKERSVWMLVDNFNIFDQVVVDCMLDMLEGICGYSMT